jgi:hypothetical protein
MLPWSFISAWKERIQILNQFQTLEVEDDFLLFKNLPLKGGQTVCAQIDFENIEKLHVKFTSIQVTFVNTFKWNGEPCSFISPLGKVPVSQRFSLTVDPIIRSQKLIFLESKGLIIIKNTSFLSFLKPVLHKIGMK